MARTGKYSIIAVAGIIVAIAAIVFAVRTMTDGINGGREVRRESGNFIEAVLQLPETTEISVEGVWKVRVLPADGEARVELNAPQEFVDYVRDGSDEQLNLGVPSGYRNIRGSLEAVVYTDSLARIRIAGASQIELEDLSLDTLRLEVEGAGNIESEDVSVNELIVIAEGAANVDFMDSSVVNADIRVEGATKVDLMMGGGYLRGSLEGIGKVRYRGEVSDRQFSIDGLGSIEYLD
jgi:hypothetical protein